MIFKPAVVVDRSMNYTKYLVFFLTTNTNENETSQKKRVTLQFSTIFGIKNIKILISSNMGDDYRTHVFLKLLAPQSVRDSLLPSSSSIYKVLKHVATFSISNVSVSTEAVAV